MRYCRGLQQILTHRYGASGVGTISPPPPTPSPLPLHPPLPPPPPLFPSLAPFAALGCTGHTLKRDSSDVGVGQNQTTRNRTPGLNPGKSFTRASQFSPTADVRRPRNRHEATPSRSIPLTSASAARSTSSSSPRRRLKGVDT